MLILTRRAGQIVDIGDNINVQVLGMERGIVRLGFTAPKGTVILRREVKERGIKRPNFIQETQEECTDYEDSDLDNKFNK